jgi:hypothetical protein
VPHKADDREAHKTDPQPPKRDNPIHKTSKIRESDTKPAGGPLSQKSAKKARGDHHKK